VCNRCDWPSVLPGNPKLKSSAMNLKYSLIIIVLSAFTAVQASAQQPDNQPEREKATAGFAIQESNFSCFQDLQCLKKENPFKSSNLESIRLNRERYDRYIVEGNSKSEQIYAIYDRSGRLMKAEVVQRNVLLPESILFQLVSEPFDSWTMIGNEFSVKNFDRSTIEYKVILERDGEVRIIYFNRHGQRTPPIS
jgi:hypothetical protein